MTTHWLSVTGGKVYQGTFVKVPWRSAHTRGHSWKTKWDYRALAAERSFEWIRESLPANTHAKTSWRCSEGHEWQARYDDIQKGRGCPHCAGNALKTAIDYHILAAERTFEWIGESLPPKVRTKTTWRCQEGHEWEAPYRRIRKGHGCPYCVGNVSKAANDYLDMANKRGFEWIGENLPPNVHTKTLWHCSVGGHEWWAPYNSIRQGKGCPYCAGQIPKTAGDYHALATGRGFAWIGESLPPTTDIKTLWCCFEGHEWQARYHSIQRGGGCPHCYGRIPKTAAGYHGMAERQGLEWIGETTPSNTVAPTLWRCPKGHEWEARYSDIAQDHGCPHCAGVASKTIADYHSMAEGQGLKWIGEILPQNVNAKTAWRCQESHEWRTPYSSIQQGGGCPTCQDMVNGARVSKPQREIAAMLGGILNYPCGRRRIDVALLNDHIAVEYDGAYYHRNESSEQVVVRDRELLAGGWKVLHLRGNNKDRLPEQAVLDAALDVLRIAPAQALTLLC